MMSTEYAVQGESASSASVNRAQVHEFARAVFEEVPMPDFEGLKPAPGLLVTAVFQGTAQLFNERRNVSQLALKAALAKHRVLLVNGIGTQTTQAQIDSFQHKTQGWGKLLPSYRNDAHSLRRRWSQALSGHAMFENAVTLIREIRGLGAIPKRIDAIGYSRGGVSATLMVTLLDFLLEVAGIQDSNKPEIRLALFDPVASLHACSEHLVSRNALTTNPKIKDNGILVFVSLDLFRRFQPQAGTAGSKEAMLVLPSNHQGLEGGDHRKKHHRAASRVAQLLSLKHFGLAMSLEDEMQLVRATLKLSAVQQDMALRLRWSAKSQSKKRNLSYWLLRLAWNDKQFRAEGEVLLQNIESHKHGLGYLFIDESVEAVFAAYFPQFNQILVVYFQEASIEGKACSLRSLEQALKSPARQGLEQAILFEVCDRINRHFNLYRVEALREARLKEIAKAPKPGRRETRAYRPLHPD